MISASESVATPMHFERRTGPAAADANAAAQLSGRDLLCFSHDWNGDPLSKTHLMRLLARDNRVLWVNSIGYRAPTASRSDLRRVFRKLAAVATPIREVERNIFAFSPFVIPAYGSAAMRSLNGHLLRLQVKRAMRRLGFSRPINWVFNPAASVIAGTLNEERLVYYCVDEYTAFTGVPRQSLIELEERLARRADLVIVSADNLLRAKRPLNPNTHLVRHGVDFEHFRRALAPETQVPAEVSSLPGPVIGYFGLIASDWVDVPLLAHVAKSFPHASLVLIGKCTMDLSTLQALANVHILGRKPYESLPAYCKGFDVALIPFPINEATIHANPLKAREYLAAGLPVVSTKIPEVEVLGECLIGSDADEFVARIAEALRKPGPSNARSERMRSESWASRLNDVLGHLQRTA